MRVNNRAYFIGPQYHLNKSGARCLVTGKAVEYRL